MSPCTSLHVTLPLIPIAYRHIKGVFPKERVTLTSQEGNQLQVDIEGKVQRRRFRQPLQSTTRSERFRIYTWSQLSRDLCPSGKDDIVCTMIALAATKGWHLQMDVKNVILQDELDKEVYMVQAPGFESSTHPTTMCQLKKPLCGLKQGRRAWYSNISNYLHRIDFRMSKFDNSLCQKQFLKSDLYHVLNKVIGGEQLVDINKVKSLLPNKFEMTDMKELHYFLGIEVC